ncbi:hypothetical protein [Acinetobacter nosocomialis]|uniref:hypothetical protein n=1 Tax=Acinetobacter nosocomialis TaxID=106654 RepID=UPI0026F4740B|nr:hypothetical protein [Acinetobacter nosocomialis]MDO7436889.1 hypothetical protein [Acinetobacter nosocomialis]
MKYIKYIFAALVIALSAPTFAKGHGYHGSHHGKAYAYHGNHHGKGYYHNKAHGDHGSDMHSHGRGHM